MKKIEISNEQIFSLILQIVFASGVIRVGHGWAAPNHRPFLEKFFF
jgi:hypothetical protein